MKLTTHCEHECDLGVVFGSGILSEIISKVQNYLTFIKVSPYCGFTNFWPFVLET